VPNGSASLCCTAPIRLSSFDHADPGISAATPGA
jgi:hypothetical protein